MKVLHVIGGGDVGGAKTHVLSLLCALRGRTEVGLVALREGPFAEAAREKGIDTLVISSKSILEDYKKLAAHAEDGGFDLIHCHGAKGNMMGALLKLRRSLPVLTTVHSDYRLDYMGRPLGALTFGVINRVALRVIKYRVGVSDPMADMLCDRGFSPYNLFSIYNGVETEGIPPAPDREEFFRSIGAEIGKEDVVCGIAARLHPVKDIATLIRAVAKARESAPRLRAVIAGDGGQEKQLRRLAEKLGVSEHVFFAGWVSDMEGFFQSIDINVLTSLSETFPYALTEGARMAKPCVSSRVGGVPRLIYDGVTGFLFEPRDDSTLAGRLSRLARDEVLRRELGRKIFEKTRDEFSVSAMAARQADIYETVLRRENREPRAREGAVLCGAYGRGNAGDEAILEAVLRELRELDPDIRVCVLSRSPRHTRREFRTDSIFTFNVPAFLRRLKKARIYINGGGSLIQDITSSRSIWFYLYTIRAAKKRGCRVLMYGCGIGPVRREMNRRLAGRILDKNADVITLREDNSLSVLGELGVKAPEVILTADPTLSLPSADEGLIDSAMICEGLNPGGDYICFALRKWPSFSEKAAFFGDAARYAFEKYGLTAVFLPIERENDVDAAEMACVGLETPHHIVRGVLEARVVTGILSRMRCVVSMRLHALIFAASRGVPLVGVAYDYKVSSFLRYMGQKLCTTIEELGAEALEGYIDRAMLLDRGELIKQAERLRAVESGNSEAAKRLLSGGAG